MTFKWTSNSESFYLYKSLKKNKSKERESKIDSSVTDNVF